MTYSTWKIQHTPFINNGYDDDDTVEMTDVTSVALILGLGTVKDNFTIKLVNFNDEYSNYFKPKDRINIYRAINTTVIDTSTDILMSGTVTDYPETLMESGQLVNVKGANYSESVLNALVFTDPVGQGLDIAEAIKSAVNSVENFNPNFGIVWDDTNATTKSDGSAFPLAAERFFNKSLSSLLEKYSANNFTGDGTYYWFVSNENKLVWKKRNAAIDYTFDKDTAEFISVKEGRDANDVINYVIVKGGTDPKGRQIQVRYQDFTSSTRYGLKFKILVDENAYAKYANAEDMFIAANSVGVSKDELANYGTLPSNLPSTPYPFDTSFGETVTDDDDYNAKIVTKVKNYLKALAIAYTELRQFGKFKVDITVYPGKLQWGLGDVITYSKTVNSATVTKTLRVSGIQYGKTADVYSMEEDVGTLK